MKILGCGDLHITDQRPANRLDENYLDTMSDKLDFIFETGDKEDCKIIIFPGDIFNTHRAKDFLKAFLADKIMNQDAEVLCVFGQHGLRYHSSDRSNTPLNVLHVAEVLSILNEAPYEIEGINFYGASFGEEIPEVKNPKTFNILVTHRMIITEKLWKEQEEFSRASILLKNTKYDLIISGDNHMGFIQTHKDKTLINCGSLMRSSIDQEDHKPFVVVYDTETRENKQIHVPVQNFNDIMNIENAVADKEKTKELEAFIKTLKETTPGLSENKAFNFGLNVSKYVTDNEKQLSKGVIDIINQVMELE